MPYVINDKTLALLPEQKQTKILEMDKVILSPDSINKIIEYNCNLNASTLEGRRKGSTYLIGVSYKPPIIITETRTNIIIELVLLVKCVFFIIFLIAGSIINEIINATKNGI